MKKLLTAGVALLSVATLAACSGKTASESSSKDAKASSSKVEKSSTSESKSSSSSKSATSSVDVPEIVLLTDEEIDNAKTLGDMIDNYTKYVKEIGDKIPVSGKDAYNKQVDPAIQSMETARKTFNDTLSAAGSDDTVVPEQARSQFAQQLKNARDIAQKALEGAYQSIAPLLSSSAE